MRTYHVLVLCSSLLLHIFTAAAPRSSASRKRQLLGSSFGVPGVDASFDYVIVGGGTAGLVLATRLAEDGKNSVAVIEAGGFYEIDNGNISVIPGEATFYAGANPNNTQPLIDWGFVTTPQAACRPRLRVPELADCFP